MSEYSIPSVVEKFLRYAKIDTQSMDGQDCFP